MTKQLLADDLERRLDAFLPHNPILLIEYENTRLLPGLLPRPNNSQNS